MTKIIYMLLICVIVAVQIFAISNVDWSHKTHEQSKLKWGLWETCTYVSAPENKNFCHDYNEPYLPMKLLKTVRGLAISAVILCGVSLIFYMMGNKKISILLLSLSLACSITTIVLWSVKLNTFNASVVKLGMLKGTYGLSWYLFLAGTILSILCLGISMK